MSIPWVIIPFHWVIDVQALTFCQGQGIEVPSGKLGFRFGMGWDEDETDTNQHRHTVAETLGHKQEPKMPVVSVLLMRNFVGHAF